MITVYFCINFNFIGNDLIKKLYNNGILNVENLTRSLFSSEWLNSTTCIRAAPGILSFMTYQSWTQVNLPNLGCFLFKLLIDFISAINNLDFCGVFRVPRWVPQLGTPVDTRRIQLNRLTQFYLNLLKSDFSVGLPKCDLILKLLFWT